MKKILLILLLVFSFQSTHAKIWLVDNSPNSPVTLTSLQIAITDSANVGDTIMVAGSPNDYGDIIISKPVVIIGEGYNDPLGENTILHNVDVRSSNVYISGISINGYVFLVNGHDEPTNTISNLIVERCNLGRIVFNGISNASPGFANMSDIYFRNNIITINAIFWGGGFFDYERMLFDTLVFENNIFNNSGINIASASLTIGTNTFIIRNNIMINQAAPAPNTFFFFQNGANISDAVVSNNIFYAANPQGCNNCTYFNNLTYQNGAADTLPPPQNGNIYSQNPLFVNYSGGAFSYNQDYHLAAGSPCIGTGVPAGSDMGIYGGLYPFNVGEGPKIPVVDYVNISNTAVPQGSTFYLQFDARVRK